LVPALLKEGNIEIYLVFVLDILFNKLLKYCNAYMGFSHRRNPLDSQIELVFRHDWGIKWYNILGKVYSAFLKQEFNYDTTVKQEKNYVIISIRDEISDDIYPYKRISREESIDFRF